MDWQAAYLKALGAPVSKQNVRFLNNWQQFEGGHTHNDARWNYLNTTWGKQYPSINSAGVRAFPNLQTGAHAFAQTLQNMPVYGGLVQGFRSGNPYAMPGRVTPGLSTWLSGSPNSTSGRAYAQKVLGGSVPAGSYSVDSKTLPPPLGQAPPKLGPAVPAGLPRLPNLASTVFSSMGLSPTQALTNLVNAVASQPLGSQPTRLNRSDVPLQPANTRGPHKPVQDVAGRVGVVSAVKSELGLPYSWGGGGPGGPSYGFAQGAKTKGFDCSSLLQYGWAKAGVKIPRVTYDQWRVGRPVQNPRPGDAVFFEPGRRGPEHVGIYIGNDKFIEAPHTGAKIRVSTLSARGDYMGARTFA
jgi:cell wall-associated NlpC family hydrolase